MKVKELIEKLQKFDPGLDVCAMDSFHDKIKDELQTFHYSIQEIEYIKGPHCDEEYLVLLPG